MRIIFSRKGFDSSSGRCPSPIIDGHPVSLPIPTSHRSETTYDLLGLGDIVERVTRGRIARDHLCHEDPMFAGDRCAFGQTHAAQSHLSNQGVSVGDVFLFFGLFSDEAAGEPHHRIFGFLKVEAVTFPGPQPSIEDDPAGFSRRHPHTIGQWNKNNTLYLGEGALCRSAPDELRLTQPGGPLTVWQTPIWLREVGLTYNDREDQWLAPDRLKVMARWQESVAQIGTDDKPQRWLKAVIDAIKQQPPRQRRPSSPARRDRLPPAVTRDGPLVNEIPAQQPAMRQAGGQDMTRLFRYILKVDIGMAPCIDASFVSLATCMHRIRQSARPGDWVAGFLPEPYPRGLVAYAGRVREVLDIGPYERDHRGRSDAVYREKKDGSFKRLLPEYHSKPGEFDKDLSGPALIFDERATWYFGDEPQALPATLSHLAVAGRGYCWRGASEKDIAEFEEWLRSNWRPGLHGGPRDAAKERPARCC